MAAKKSAKTAKSTKSTAPTKTARSAKSPTRHGNPWSSADMTQLRQLARRATPMRDAAQQLGRSLDSVKSKASEEGISFKPVRATKRTSGRGRR